MQISSTVKKKKTEREVSWINEFPVFLRCKVKFQQIQKTKWEFGFWYCHFYAFTSVLLASVPCAIWKLLNKMSMYAQGEYSGQKEKEVMCQELALLWQIRNILGAGGGGVCPIVSCSQVRFYI